MQLLLLMPFKGHTVLKSAPSSKTNMLKCLLAPLGIEEEFATDLIEEIENTIIEIQTQ